MTFRILSVLDLRDLFPGGWTGMGTVVPMPRIMGHGMVELALRLVRGIWGCRPCPSGMGFCSEEALLCQSQEWQGGITNQLFSLKF